VFWNNNLNRAIRIDRCTLRHPWPFARRREDRDRGQANA